LSPGESVSFVCSADPIDFDKAVAEADRECAQLDAPIVSPPGGRDTDHDLLVRAAERFVVDLPTESVVPQPPAMITKFPWASPSTRDALIAFTGVLLVTGKFTIARSMLLSLAARIRGGVIPNEFPENGSQPLYNGADTSLWFINAVHQYVRYTGDEATA